MTMVLNCSPTKTVLKVSLTRAVSNTYGSKLLLLLNSLFPFKEERFGTLLLHSKIVPTKTGNTLIHRGKKSRLQFV
jgi:hypothetical protein